MQTNEEREKEINEHYKSIVMILNAYANCRKIPTDYVIKGGTINMALSIIKGVLNTKQNKTDD